MKAENVPDQFVQDLIDCQPRLHAYILSLLPNWSDANDVLQETNLAMWRSSGEFVQGTNFVAWAYKIARYRVLASCRKQHRERQIFGGELFALVADEAERRTLLDRDESPIVLLRECVRDLSPLQRELLERRYAENGSVRMTAESLGRSAAVVSVTLSRIRGKLLKCVRRKLLREKAEP